MLIDLNWNLSGFSVFSLCLTGSGHFRILELRSMCFLSSRALGAVTFYP